MRPQAGRLPADSGKGLGGNRIDRQRPIRFRLQGRMVSGFAGDSVLSAALASGIDSVGHHMGHPVGLSQALCPLIRHARRSNDPGNVLPMDRYLPRDGDDLVMAHGPGGTMLARLFRPGRTLGLQLDRPGLLDQPWRRLAAQQTMASDVVVVGGGIAGLSAALAAAQSGLSVILVEAQPYLGGISGLFGTQDGEQPPESDMTRLADAAMTHEAIQVFTATEAFAIRQGRIRIHRVTNDDREAPARVIDIDAPRIVLATGAVERLPVFSGNLLPGVVGSQEAYALASRYGVWPGRKALVSTGSNIAYRLATLAADSGVEVLRILDGRANPNSRFIAFSRAYGIVQSPGTTVVEAGIAKAAGQLWAKTNTPDETLFTADRLIVCGGWQPDLALWHAAGGTSLWHNERHRLEAGGALEGIVLAGSAAGYLTRTACIDSGRQAINRLLGRRVEPATDQLIAPIYETPDAATGIADMAEDAAPAYLDRGRDLTYRSKPRKRAWFARRQPSEDAQLLETMRPLTGGEVAACVGLGVLVPDQAGDMARERAAFVPLPLRETGVADATPSAAPEPIPRYLNGRFGSDARIVHLHPGEARQFDIGALVYPNSDPAPPERAIGVVLRPMGEYALALLAADMIEPGAMVSVQEIGRSSAARVELAS